MKNKQNLLKLSIIDPFGNKVYNTKVSLSDKRELASAFFILRKYDIDLDEISDLIKKEEMSFIRK